MSTTRGNLIATGRLCVSFFSFTGADPRAKCWNGPMRSMTVRGSSKSCLNATDLRLTGVAARRMLSCLFPNRKNANTMQKPQLRLFAGLWKRQVSRMNYRHDGGLQMHMHETDIRFLFLLPLLRTNCVGPSERKIQAIALRARSCHRISASRREAGRYPVDLPFLYYRHLQHDNQVG